MSGTPLLSVLLWLVQGYASNWRFWLIRVSTSYKKDDLTLCCKKGFTPF